MSKVYTHRKYPDLIVQDVIIRNPSDDNVDVDLSRVRPCGPNHRDGRLANQNVDICTYTTDTTNNKLIVVTTVAAKLAARVSVRAKSSESFRVLTVVDYSEPTVKDMFDQQRKEMERVAMETYGRLAAIAPNTLDAEHVNVWKAVRGESLCSHTYSCGTPTSSSRTRWRPTRSTIG